MDELTEAQGQIADALKVPVYTVSDFLMICNQTLEYSFSSAVIVGEVASFKVNQGKWVFFDLKDDDSTVSCFMPLWDLRMELEDGMKVVVKGTPKLTKWGKFSITVKQMRPMGEGSIKRQLMLLKKKLEAEGLFNPEGKRPIPKPLSKIGVISSTQAAGYADFCKILNERWGGMEVLTAHTQVQGLDAPDQIIRALKYFNERGEVDIIAIIRGGGSADDLAAFNDEKLVRAIAASKIPVITGIGHEVDESLADLAADIRASTPSNVAEMLTPDRQSEKARIKTMMTGVLSKIRSEITTNREKARLKLPSEKISQAVLKVREKLALRRERMGAQILVEANDIKRRTLVNCDKAMRMMWQLLQNEIKDIHNKQKILLAVNPDDMLRRGYAIVSGKITEGNVVKITTFEKVAKAQIVTQAKRE